jgi:hypothetical protein
MDSAAASGHPEPGSPVTALERRILLAGAVVAAVAVGTQTALHLLATLVLDTSSGLPWWLDADHEGTQFSWASGAATFAAALALALIVLVRNTAAPGLILLAALIAYLSLDDIARLHEQLAQKLREGAFENIRPEFIDRSWVVVYVPLLAVVAVLLLRMTRDRRPADGLVRLGLLLLALAVGFEVAGLGTTLLADESTTWPDSIEVALEEGAELGGWILIAAGLSARLVVEVAYALRDARPPPERKRLPESTDEALSAGAEPLVIDAAGGPNEVRDGDYSRARAEHGWLDRSGSSRSP